MSAERVLLGISFATLLLLAYCTFDLHSELTATRVELSLTRERFAEHATDLKNHERRLGAVESTSNPTLSAQEVHRLLQTTPTPTPTPEQHKGDTCVGADTVALASLDSSYSLSEAFKAFESGTPSKGMLPLLLAKQASLQAEMATKFGSKEVNEAIANSPSGNDASFIEFGTCRRAVCADLPVNGSMCVPWGVSKPVDCINSTAEEEHSFPRPAGGLPCCRAEWPLFVATTQASTKAPQVFPSPDITVRTGALVTFTWTGFENLEQVDNFNSLSAVTSGIRSGNPSYGGQFNFTFAKQGIYYMRSQVHESLRVAVTVMDCVYCAVINGYDGVHARSFAVALSSRSKGKYSLRVSNHASLGFLTIYSNQNVTINGIAAPGGQMALLDASIHVLKGGFVSGITKLRCPSSVC